MPTPVDKYYKQVMEGNPDYSPEKAWATAWSVYCRYKDPSSDSCHKPTSEYLKRAAVRYALKYEPKESKDSKVVRVTQQIRKATGLSRGVAEAIADAHVRGRDVERLAIQKSWPLDRGTITGPSGTIKVSELKA